MGLVFTSCTPDNEVAFVPSARHILHEHNFYKDFEYLHFVASYGPLDIGELFLESQGVVTVRNTPCYLVDVHANLNGVAGGFADIENQWASYVDTVSLLPVHFWRDIKENKYRKKELTWFDRNTMTAFVKDTTHADHVQNKSYPITSAIEDLVSSFYLFRNAPFHSLKAGDTITIDVFMENASYNAKARYLGKEKIKFQGKKREAIVISPILSGIKILVGDHPIRVWLSNDASKLPMHATVRTLLGSVSMDLKEFRTAEK